MTPSDLVEIVVNFRSRLIQAMPFVDDLVWPSRLAHRMRMERVDLRALSFSQHHARVPDCAPVLWIRQFPCCLHLPPLAGSFCGGNRRAYYRDRSVTPNLAQECS